MAHQWEHLETAYESVRLPSAEKQKAPQQNHKQSIKQSDNQVTCSTYCPPHTFPFYPLIFQEILVFFYVAINSILCFTQTLIQWWKRNLCPYATMTYSVAKQKSSHSSYVFTFSLCKQASRISALPDLRHVFSFQSWSHSWLSGLDYLCCSWSWRFKAFGVSLVSVHWSW